MARYNFKLKSPISEEFSVTPIVASGGATTILAGEPTKLGSSGAVAIMADGDGTTSQRFTGIAKSDSTDTVAAAGVVQVWLPFPGLIYTGAAKSAAAADTQAEINALFGKRVIFDLTGTAWTIDTAESDAATNGVVIVGGDYQTSTIWFCVSPTCTVFE
jgi:hypothetical protein